jgi:hypothetical protein
MLGRTGEEGRGGKRRGEERSGEERRGEGKGQECARPLSPCSTHTACPAEVEARGALLHDGIQCRALLALIASRTHNTPPSLSPALSSPPSLPQWEHAVLWQLNYGVTYGLNTVLFSECQRSRYVVTMEEDWLWIESKMQVYIPLSLSPSHSLSVLDTCASTQFNHDMMTCEVPQG